MDDAVTQHRMNPVNQCIETYKGHKFYLDMPIFDVEEIAHAISKKCRFNGHCRRFYSVAEHSLLVSGLMEQYGLGDPFEGLMHDAHEAYLPDVPSPWKPLMPEFCAIEHDLEAKMRINYGLPPVPTDGCKMADRIAMCVEANQLMPSKGQDWICPPAVRERANRMKGLHINGYEPNIARDHFMSAFAELAGPRGFYS